MKVTLIVLSFVSLCASMSDEEEVKAKRQWIEICSTMRSDSTSGTQDYKTILQATTAADCYLLSTNRNTYLQMYDVTEFYYGLVADLLTSAQFFQTSADLEDWAQ